MPRAVCSVKLWRNSGKVSTISFAWNEGIKFLDDFFLLPRRFD